MSKKIYECIEISDLKDIAHFGYSSDVLMYVTEDTTKFIYIYEE